MLVCVSASVAKFGTREQQITALAVSHNNWHDTTGKTGVNFGWLTGTAFCTAAVGLSMLTGVLCEHANEVRTHTQIARN